MNSYNDGYNAGFISASEGIDLHTEWVEDDPKKWPSEDYQLGYWNGYEDGISESCEYAM